MRQKKIRLAGISLPILLSFACSLFSFPQKDTLQAPAFPTLLISPSFTPTPFPSRQQPLGVAAKNHGMLILFDREGYTLAQVNATGIAETSVKHWRRRS